MKNIILLPSALIWIIAAVSCSSEAGIEEEAGHTHDESSLTVTQWTEKSELFMEYPRLIAGETAKFVVHVTALRDFKPVTAGSLACIFRKGGMMEAAIREEAPSVPGIFLPAITLPAAGDYTMEIIVAGAHLDDTIRVSGLHIHPPGEDMPPVSNAPAAGERISFLKEQQWKTEFSTSFAGIRELNPSIAAVGEILPKPGYYTEVSAPISGIILERHNDDLPVPGKIVRKGDVLLHISPPPEIQTGIINIRSEFLLAKAEYERSKRLYEKNAISKKRFDEAQLAFDSQKARYGSVSAQLKINEDPNDDGYVQLTAPISGYIDAIHFNIGESVKAGDRLFTVINPQRLILKARMPAQFISRLPEISSASFKAEGIETEFDLSTLNGRLLSIGYAIDKDSRTVPVYFEFDNPGDILKVNMIASASLKFKNPLIKLALPESAIIEENNLPTTFVQIEGESFEKRLLKTGIMDRGYVEIMEGVSVGERVVTKGAYQIKLSSLSSSVPTGHGHEH